MIAGKQFFIAEISSNHAQNLDRCVEFIRTSARIGCQAVKFQLFKIEELFAQEILAASEEHRSRRKWELPIEFLPELQKVTHAEGLQFSCTPFYLEAVDELLPFVDFYKIASYELLWDDLISACAKTGKPLVLSTGMATLNEVCHAVDVFKGAGGAELQLLHCVSGYPVIPEHCNLAAIETIRKATDCRVGWSDHSKNPTVVTRAIDRWDANVVEFHLDLDEHGAEYAAGHCWLPHEMEKLIASRVAMEAVDGSGLKAPTPAELPDCNWRADPSDGLRPFLDVRKKWQNA